jgi:hypothetical protein
VELGAGDRRDMHKGLHEAGMIVLLRWE